LPPNFQFNKLRTNPTDPSASSKPNTSASLTTNTNKTSEQPTQLSIVAEEKLTTTTTITNNNNTNNNSNNKFVSSVSEQNVSSSQKDDDVSGTDHGTCDHLGCLSSFA
jgi:Rieske Fe-S protein